MSLGRKQRIDNSAWLEAVATIEDAVSREELDELTAATVADIKATTAGKRAAYAWSAGKDSIVLGKLCEAAGVTDSMIGVCDLEYPAFAAWIEEHKPDGCEVINTRQDIDWLAKHPEMLSPKTPLRPDAGSPSFSTEHRGSISSRMSWTSSFSVAGARTAIMSVATAISTPMAKA